MKKEIFILMIILFSINIIYAEPFLEIQSIETLQPGETLFGKISIPDGELFSGNLQKENIKLYEERKQIAIEREIISYNNEYFFYIYLNKEGNFTIKIQDILYKNSENILQSKAIEQEIQIKKTLEIVENSTIYKTLSIKPGFIYTTGNPELILTNNGNIELNLSISDDEPEINIQPQQTKKIYPIAKEAFSFLNISTYKEFSIPFIFISLNSTNNFVQEEKNSIRVVPTYIHANLANFDNQNQTLEIFNFAENNISNILISKNLDIIKIKEEISINAKSSEKISFEISPDKEGYFEDKILFQYTEENNSFSVEIPVYIYVFPENTTQEQMTISGESCEELGGNSCNSGESCDGQSTITKAGEYCCIGTCKKVESEKNYSWLIGVGILIILVVAGFFIFKKYKKIKPSSPEQALKQSSEKFDKRIKGGLTRS